MSQKSQLKYEADFNKKISRLFIFRFFLMVIEVWIVWIWAIWIAIVSFVHFFYMLILGQRCENLWRRKLRFQRHISKWNAYLTALIDERPEWIED